MGYETQFWQVLDPIHILVVSPIGVNDINWGARYLKGENLEVVWAEFSTLSWAVFL